MILVEHCHGTDVLVIRVSGTLTRNDYDFAIPEIENAAAIVGGPLRILLRLEDIRGAYAGAVLRDLEFRFNHRGIFSRIAVIAEPRLEVWATLLAGALTGAPVRFFPTVEEREAWDWLEVDETAADPLIRHGARFRGRTKRPGQGRPRQPRE